MAMEQNHFRDMHHSHQGILNNMQKASRFYSGAYVGSLLFSYSIFITSRNLRGKLIYDKHKGLYGAREYNNIIKPCTRADLPSSEYEFEPKFTNFMLGGKCMNQYLNTGIELSNTGIRYSVIPVNTAVPKPVLHALVGSIGI